MVKVELNRCEQKSKNTMDILINPNLDRVSWQAAVDLMDKVDWEPRVAHELRTAFEKSSYSCFVYDNDKLVGFGRTMDDGQYYALIADVVVDPAYQGSGIGSVIVTKLKDALKGYFFITLSAAPGKHGFYEKLNWKKQTSSFIWPLSEKQRKDHTE